MQRSTLITALLLAPALFPMHVYAQDEPGAIELVARIVELIFNPLLGLLMAIAFAVFVFGGTRTLMAKDNADMKEKSKKIMMWGIIGLFIMVSAFGIINFIVDLVGADDIYTVSDRGDVTVTIPE